MHRLLLKESSKYGYDVYVKYYEKDDKGIKPKTIIPHEYGRSEIGQKELIKLFGTRLFETPKPEILLKYFIDITTEENDLVLDYFLGSGTTCAVAHKLNRQYIGIEENDYVESLVLKRMDYVIAGDGIGISTDIG